MNQEEEKQVEIEYSLLNVDAIEYKTTLTKKYLKRKAFADLDRSKITSFISGTIKDVFVKKGKKIKEGDQLLVLEAMKMRNIIKAPMDGKIKKIHVKPEQRVAKHDLLVEID